MTERFVEKRSLKSIFIADIPDDGIVRESRNTARSYGQTATRRELRCIVRNDFKKKSGNAVLKNFSLDIYRMWRQNILVDFFPGRGSKSAFRERNYMATMQINWRNDHDVMN